MPACDDGLGRATTPRHLDVTRPVRLRTALAVALAVLAPGVGGALLAAPAAADGPQLLVSSSSDGRSAVALDGQTLAGQVYVRFEPSSPVRSVRFWLDDPDRSGAPDRDERLAPYDFAGGQPSSLPWDTSSAPGAHTITAEVTRDDGTTYVDEASFSVGTGDGPAVGAAPTPTPVPTPRSASGDDLSWARPTLVSPRTVEVSDSRRSLRLEAGKDYVVEMPSRPVRGGVTITGGDDVVLVGGEVSVPNGMGNRAALHLVGQTGTVHVEGLAITGPGLADGITLDQRKGAVVQLQNIRVDTAQGSYAGRHADLIQTWAGPRELRVDKFTGITEYQGMFLLPNQFSHKKAPDLFDLRRVDVTGLPGHGYLFWRDSASWPMKLTDVRVQTRSASSSWAQYLWPRRNGDREHTWGGVDIGQDMDRAFVPAGVAGPGYTSPGYSSD